MAELGITLEEQKISKFNKNR